jgi:hypothetical protein
MATQRERVLSMLKAAGSRGVRSDEFIRDFMPRGAARIQDLKDEGVQITSEREGKYTRYRLLSDHHAASHSGRFTSGEYSQDESAAESHEGREAGGLKQLRRVPSMFDADIDWAA